MSLQHLQGDDERIAEEIRIDGRMENVNRSVVRSGEEKREGGREGDRTQSLRVIAESLVRRGGKVEVVPDKSFVVGSHNHVVCER